MPGNAPINPPQARRYFSKRIRVTLSRNYTSVGGEVEFGSDSMPSEPTPDLIKRVTYEVERQAEAMIAECNDVLSQFSAGTNRKGS